MKSKEIALSKLKKKGVVTMRELKDERFNLRLKADTKLKIERLSEFLEISMTQVILTAVDLLNQELSEFLEGDTV